VTPDNFDWKHPEYGPIIVERFRRLQYIRENPEILPDLKRFYRDQPWQFLTDWGWTADPRNVEVGLPVLVPFILFPKQIEFAKWIVERWKAREPGAAGKSREVGATWVAGSLAATMCMFNDDLAIGVGSRKLELVDSLDDPKAIMPKIRQFLNNCPRDFTGEWSSREKLIKFANGSTIAGEGGDDIGRGGRTSWYLVDESAFLQHPESIDASLSANTNCRIDLSTPNGSANSFARKFLGWPANRVFQLHWRDDPRKDEAWYQKQKDQLDPVVLAQEVDMDFSASVEGIVIPSAWVQAAIDAHIHLDIKPTGERLAALDIADRGKDLNALAACRGVLIDHVDQWTGKDGDIYASVVKAFGQCDDLDVEDLLYDADGMGAGVRGDARMINEARRADGYEHSHVPRLINVRGFHGSGKVEKPDTKIYPGANRTNADYYKNLKAQSWGNLRRLFRETFRARSEPGYNYDPSQIISLCSKMPLLQKLTTELSQPTWEPDNTGKMVVNKQPDDSKSPNLADAVMMVKSGARRRMIINR